MKCIDFENRLNELLDERRLPQHDALLAAHADQCADCRETLAVQESLFRGMAALQRRTVLPELGKRVLHEIDAAIPPVSAPSSSYKWNWLPLLASAAALLLAVTFGYWLVNRGHNEIVNGPHPRGARGEGLAIIKPATRQPQPSPIKSPVVPSPALSPETVAVKPAPMAPMLIDENNEAYRQAMASLASRWPANAQWPHMETIDVEHYAPGIRPIRETFEVALDALLRTIPGKKEARNAPPQAQHANDDLFNIA